MIKKNTEKEQNTIYLENILSGTNRLEDIVKAVMDYTEIPAVDLDALDLRKLLDNVRVLIDEKAGKLTLDLNWNIKCGAVNAVLDPELVGQALNEILTNSLESFSGGKGSIDITVSKDNTVFSMKIIDNGSGISEEDMPYIFDPFFTTKAVGSGMGLCKAVKIIREHKGDLLIHSKAGIGTTATIRLPANP